MRKLLVTRLEDRILTALVEDGTILELSVEEAEPGPLVGDIYVAQVKSVAKQLQAAFVDLGGGQMAYLPLDQSAPLIANGAQAVCEGCLVLVQISKEAVKTKAPVVSGKLSLPGAGIVLLYPKRGISFSAKIKDEAWKKEMRALLTPYLPEEAGIIVRTNGYEMMGEQLVEAVQKQAAELLDILSVYRYRTCFSRLHQGMPQYIGALLRHGADGDTAEIVTDDAVLLEEMKDWAQKDAGLPVEKLRFYEDPLLPLKKLHSLETGLERALREWVWLPCGGYLIIQPTEALTVIDVNTGKNEGRKKKEALVWETNREAAEEIAAQLRLRNLSGIVIVDFIDMEGPEQKEALLEQLRRAVKKDPVPTWVVDMTALGLVELTRKRVRKPLHEQVKGWRK